jgi:hypothetical protein
VELLQGLRLLGGEQGVEGGHGLLVEGLQLPADLVLSDRQLAHGGGGGVAVEGLVELAFQPLGLGAQRLGLGPAGLVDLLGGSLLLGGQVEQLGQVGDHHGVVVRAARSAWSSWSAWSAMAAVGVGEEAVGVLGEDHAGGEQQAGDEQNGGATVHGEVSLGSGAAARLCGAGLSLFWSGSPARVFKPVQGFGKKCKAAQSASL